MDNKIKTISQCNSLINEHAVFLSGINLDEAKLIVEKIVMIKDGCDCVQTVDFGLVNSKFINLIKSGQDVEANEIIAGCLGKCSSRLSELVDFDIYGLGGKVLPSRIIIDAVRWGEFARNLLFKLNKYRATGVFYDAKFKNE